MGPACHGPSLSWPHPLDPRVARAGLDLAEMDATIAAEPQTYIDIIAANQQAHREAGHWGVPTMVFEGEPFFGQDRIDLLQWRVARGRVG